MEINGLHPSWAEGLRLKKPCLFVCAVLLLIFAGQTQAAEKDPVPGFTVQLGSYRSIESARQDFDACMTLYSGIIDRLRVESHPPHMALRAGFFADFEDALDLQHRVKSRFPGAIVLEARYLEQRIALIQDAGQAGRTGHAPYSPAGVAADRETLPGSIVPVHQQIADYHAMVMLAELLLDRGGAKGLTRAGHILEKLERAYPEEQDAVLLRIRVEAAQNNRDRVAALADDYINTAEYDPDTFTQVADFFAWLGHYERCRDIYLLVLDRENEKVKPELEAVFAQRLLLWGDFYASELIIRKQADLYDDPEQILLLARNFIAQQRFEEARGLLNSISGNAGDDSGILIPAGVEKIVLSLLEKDFKRAARDTDEYLSSFGAKRQVLIPGARAYFKAGRVKDSEALFMKALEDENLKGQALYGLGRIMLYQGRNKEAGEYFSMISSDDPEYPGAMVLSLNSDLEGLSRFVDGYVYSQSDPERLSSLAAALAAQGYFSKAILAYQAALDMDGQYFPARIGLAEVLGSAGEYRQSLDILESMLEMFPQSCKLILTRARVLSWSRNYCQSLKAYDQMYLVNPANPVVSRESARTAYWGKMPEKGRQYYQRIFTPGVDLLLLDKIRTSDRIMSEPRFYGPVTDLAGMVEQGSVFQGYESFFSWYDGQDHDLDEDKVLAVQMIRDELDHLCLLQKRVFLEQKTKDLSWNRRFAQARRGLMQLTDCDPGNQEALFDLAQACCVLGLGDGEESAYKELLSLDPLHGQVGKALERLKIRSGPQVFGGYSFWREKGRGDLARMTRHRLDMGLEVPVLLRHTLKLTTHEYFELPQKYGDMVSATGATLEGQVVTGPYLVFAGGITRKVYSSSLKVRNFSRLSSGNVDNDSFRTGLKDMTTGYLDLRVNLDDYATLCIGYEKREEPANVMALAQGIYSQRIKAGIDFYPARRMDISLDAQYLEYSDNNYARLFWGRAGYALTDHPRSLGVAVTGGYRDTSREYMACTGEDPEWCMKKGIRHPYWTPRDYLETSIVFEFRHDLAEEFYCGARQHYYDLKLILGTDVDGNDSIEAKALWKKEFSDRLGLTAQAMWHESREWKAMAAELGISFRF